MIKATRYRPKTIEDVDQLPSGSAEGLAFFKLSNRRHEVLAVTEKDLHNGMWTIEHQLGTEERMALPAKYRNGCGWWVGTSAFPFPTPKHIPKDLDPHERDMRIIQWALWKEAERREWCDEFESFVKKVNPHLSRPLKGRR